ncbi:MAG: SDR family NAD(P)-dependent oxidoreductase, partial [Erysipelotrichaceae bacterium]
ATRNIGYYISLACAQAGYLVFALDYTLHQPLPKHIHYLEVDLRDKEAIQEAFNWIFQEYGPIYALINNAAISQVHTPILEMEETAFWDILNVNVKGAYLCSQAFVANNQESKHGGRIINIASTRYAQNEPDWDAYGASKGALVSLTQSLAISLAPYHICVNAISPGWIVCDPKEELRSIDHAQHPSNRVGKPQDISNAVIFLLDPQNDFINGHNLVIDGGMSKKMIYEP